MPFCHVSYEFYWLWLIQSLQKQHYNNSLYTYVNVGHSDNMPFLQPCGKVDINTSWAETHSGHVKLLGSNFEIWSPRNGKILHSMRGFNLCFKLCLVYLNIFNVGPPLAIGSGENCLSLQHLVTPSCKVKSKLCMLINGDCVKFDLSSMHLSAQLHC